MRLKVRMKLWSSTCMWILTRSQYHAKYCENCKKRKNCFYRKGTETFAMRRESKHPINGSGASLSLGRMLSFFPDETVVQEAARVRKKGVM
jgi:hypothetical protein